MIFVLGIFVIELLFGCVSQTLPSQRFNESNRLMAPLTGVAVSDPENFTFAIVGDLHVGNQDVRRFQRILNAASAEGDAFIALLGDIVDSGEADDFTAVQNALISAGYEQKTAPVLGNHDIFYDGWTAYKKVFGPSHYSFAVGNSQFVVIDTADGTVAQAEKDWIEQSLSEGAYSHRFLLSHYLPEIPGYPSYLKLSDDSEARHLMRVMAKAGITAWLGGHYHSFLTAEVAGVSIVVAGGGGRRMPPVTDFFFVQVIVHGKEVTYQLRPVT